MMEQLLIGQTGQLVPVTVGRCRQRVPAMYSSQYSLRRLCNAAKDLRCSRIAWPSESRCMLSCTSAASARTATESTCISWPGRDLPCRSVDNASPPRRCWSAPVDGRLTSRLKRLTCVRINIKNNNYKELWNRTTLHWHWQVYRYSICP